MVSHAAGANRVCKTIYSEYYMTGSDLFTSCTRGSTTSSPPTSRTSLLWSRARRLSRLYQTQPTPRRGNNKRGQPTMPVFVLVVCRCISKESRWDGCLGCLGGLGDFIRVLFREYSAEVVVALVKGAWWGRSYATIMFQAYPPSCVWCFLGNTVEADWNVTCTFFCSPCVLFPHKENRAIWSSW